LQLTEEGETELIRLGKRHFANMLKSLLDAVEPVAVPKRFRYVDVMPVNSQGKKETAALKQLLEQ
jgi:acyl-coenzyme A synthetase/AMP-(fatty) acid ligase